MALTGTIVSVVPTQKGGYTAGSGKYIYTYMMTIRGPQGGTKTGEIGSTATPYPMQPGETITVNERQGQYGLMFTKVKEQGGGGGSRADVPGQVRMHVVCSAIQSGQINGVSSPDDVKQWVDYILTGTWPGPANAPQNVSNQNVPQDQRDGGCSDPPEEEVPW